MAGRVGWLGAGLLSGLVCTVSLQHRLSGSPKERLTVPAMFLILLFNMVKAVGFILFVFYGAVNRNYRLLACAVLFYFAFLTGPLVNTRYHLPVSLIFIGCSIIGFQKLLLRRTR